MIANNLRVYYMLTKPGIIRGNLVTAAAGFFLASKGHIDWGLLLALLAGVVLVVGAGCVLNNYIDRGIDQKMTRTKKRALAMGIISGREALFFAAVLGVLGFMTLAFYTNWLTVFVGLTGLFFYVVVYGIAKRKTVHGTLIGTVSGAVPPVAGYTAVAGQLDAAAIILFLIMVFWQLSHFYSIAIFRAHEYAAAGIPVLPLKKGIPIAKAHILACIVAFTVAATALTMFGYASMWYAVVSVLLGVAWFWKGLRGLRAKDNAHWARMMFGFSLVVILAWSTLLAIDATFS